MMMIGGNNPRGDVLSWSSGCDARIIRAPPRRRRLCGHAMVARGTSSAARRPPGGASERAH